MTGLLASHPSLTLGLLVPATSLVVSLVYLRIKYAPIIGQKFEESPLFLPLRVTAEEQGESVTFTARDGIALAGSYFRARTPTRAGVLVYCHEFLSDRWSYLPYIDHMRDLGFDVFTFDFRNHGASGVEPGYQPMHWASDREVGDLRAALAYLRSRPDRDPAGFGLFGVSRGGTTALLVTPAEPDVWGIVTDGAFPTIGTMMAYIDRWAELYIPNPIMRNGIPRWLYRILARSGRRRSERGRGCRYPDLEKAVARLAPRPWLAIHGQRDTYISPEIVEELIAHGDGPRELWLVPDAKHNRCREREPEAYAGRLLDFVDRYAPRRPITESSRPEFMPAKKREPSPSIEALPEAEESDAFESEIQPPKIKVATPVR